MANPVMALDLTGRCGVAWWDWTEQIMKTKWQLREPYFQGANTYKIGPEGQEIEVAVDRNGVFELDAPPTFPLGIFARSPD
jgi:hypothetical protein